MMPDVSFGSALRLKANLDPTRPALTARDGTLTRLELANHVDAVARKLLEMGIEKDDVIAFTGHNSVRSAVLTLSVWRAGATPLAIPHGKSDHETEILISRGAPKLVFGFSDRIACKVRTTNEEELYEHAARSTAAKDDLQLLPDILGSHLRIGVSGGSTDISKLIVSKIPPTINPDSPWPAGMRANGTQVMALNIHDGNGLVFLPVALATGNHVVVMDTFEPEETLRLIERFKADFVSFSQPMMLMTLKLPSEIRSRYDISSLRAMTQVSSAAADWLKRAWIEWLGPERVWETYGAADSRGTLRIDGTEWLQHPGSVGRPQGSIEAGIFDEHGIRVGHGKVGRIYLRDLSGRIDMFYIGRELDELPGGWSTFGDVGWLDADNYLYIADRLKDVIPGLSGPIYPLQIEGELERHPAIRSAAVFGLPDSAGTETVHAVLDVPNGTIDTSELRAMLRHHLHETWIPSSFSFVSERLRDNAGKVRRSQLRATKLQG